MTKVQKDVLHIAIDAVFMACIIAGGFYAVEWAENVATGYVVLQLVLVVLMRLTMSTADSTGQIDEPNYKKAMVNLYQRKHMWPYSTTSSAIEAFVMIAAGWCWMATFYLLAVFIVINIRDDVVKFVENGH